MKVKENKWKAFSVVAQKVVDYCSFLTSESLCVLRVAAGELNGFDTTKNLFQIIIYSNLKSNFHVNYTTNKKLYFT